MSGGYTPGPWDIQAHAYDKRIAVGIGLVEGPNGYDVAEVYADDCDRDEALANARLIAAGPEMVEALQNMLAAHNTDAPECVAARALLARIESGDA
jgi:hypothetical protein